MVSTILLIMLIHLGEGCKVEFTRHSLIESSSRWGGLSVLKHWWAGRRGLEDQTRDILVENFSQQSCQVCLISCQSVELSWLLSTELNFHLNIFLRAFSSQTNGFGIHKNMINSSSDIFLWLRYFSGDQVNLHRRLLSKHPLAVCNDGSPARFHLVFEMRFSFFRWDFDFF